MAPTQHSNETTTQHMEVIITPDDLDPPLRCPPTQTSQPFPFVQTLPTSPQLPTMLNEYRNSPQHSPQALYTQDPSQQGLSPASDQKRLPLLDPLPTESIPAQSSPIQSIQPTQQQFLFPADIDVEQLLSTNGYLLAPPFIGTLGNPVHSYPIQLQNELSIFFSDLRALNRCISAEDLLPEEQVAIRIQQLERNAVALWGKLGMALKSETMTQVSHYSGSC